MKNIIITKKYNCLFCNKILQKHTKYCSKQCCTKYYNSINKTEIICANCSKKSLKYISKTLRKSNLKFCNRSCQASYANRTWNKSSRFGINKSRAEKILVNIIKNDFPSLHIIENDRNTLPNSLEFDIYIPSKKIAIELNGPVHYFPIYGQEKLKRCQNNDLLKQLEIQQKNINLLIINISHLTSKKLTEKFLTEYFNKYIIDLLEDKSEI